jgi:hypothetical protein
MGFGASWIEIWEKRIWELNMAPTAAGYWAVPMYLTEGTKKAKAWGPVDVAKSHMCLPWAV